MLKNVFIIIAFLIFFTFVYASVNACYDIDFVVKNESKNEIYVSIRDFENQGVYFERNLSSGETLKKKLKFISSSGYAFHIKDIDTEQDYSKTYGYVSPDLDDQHVLIFNTNNEIQFSTKHFSAIPSLFSAMLRKCACLI